MSDPTRGGHGPKPSRSNAGWRTAKEFDDDRREAQAHADSVLSGKRRQKKPGIGGAIGGVINKLPAPRTPAQKQEQKDYYMHYPRTASGGFGEPRRIGPRPKPKPDADETERKQRAQMRPITDDEIAARKMGRR